MLEYQVAIATNIHYMLWSAGTFYMYFGVQVAGIKCFGAGLFFFGASGSRGLRFASLVSDS
jgi:hypothetical protein